MARTLQSYKKLFEGLKGGKIHPVYLLCGPEEYLKAEFISELIKTALPERNRAFNLDILYGDEFDRDAFHDRMSTFPLFTERRVVIVRKFEALSVSNKDFVLERMKAIPESLILVVETADEKFDTARMKTLKAIADENGLAFQFKYLSEGETLERVKGRFGKEGLAIEPEALDLLIESVGTGLIDLVNEVEKLALYAGEGGVITRDIVGEVVGKYRTENVFAFLDFFGRRDVGNVIRHMNKLLDGGEEPVMVLGTLIRRVLLLLQAKFLLAEEGSRVRSPRALAARIGGPVSPFYAKVLLEQAERFELEELEVLLENLRWVDGRLKSTQTSPRGLIETAVFAATLRKKLALFGR